MPAVSPGYGTTVAQSAVVAATADLSAPSVASANHFDRKAVEFYNNGSVVVYVSSSPTYATAVAAGRPVAAGASWTDGSSTIAWYVYAASATADVRITLVY